MSFVLLKNTVIKIIKSPLFAAIFFYLFFQLQLFNVGIDLQDEGVFSYGALNITQGLIPYKDFFLTPTPGSLYLLAFFMKVFGNYLILDRLLAIGFTIILLITASSLFKLSRPFKYLYLFSLALINIHPTDFIGENAAIEILLLGFLFLIKNLETPKKKFVITAGMLASLAFVFKQSFGALAIPSFFLIGILFSARKNIKDFIFYYLAGSISVLGLFFGYFYLINGFHQLIYYTFLFAASAKGHETSFLVHRLIFIPVCILFIKAFLKSSRFNKILLLLIILLSGITYLIFEPARLGRLVDYVFDPVFYVYTFLTILPILVIVGVRTGNKKGKIYLSYSILLLLLFLSTAASGYSLGVLYACLPVLIPLCIYFFHKHIKQKKFINLFLISGTVFITLFLSFNPITSYSKISDIFISNKFNQSLPVREAAFIKVNISQKKELTFVINYVKTHTDSKQRIFCFPLCPTMYLLTERNNATFYNIIFPETFLISDQSKAIEQLQKNKAALILVMKKGDYFPTVDIQKNRYLGLYAYIVSNFQLKASTQNFNIYQK